MQDLTDYLVLHKDELNLSDISRRAGYDSQFLRHVVSGRRRLTAHSMEKVHTILETLVTDLPTKRDLNASK